MMVEIQNQSDKSSPSEVRQIRHEINNALTGLIGQAQLLRMRGNLDEKAHERVVKIEEMANRIRELAAQLSEEE
ncbi:MAG TPA: histidine kinase dimerization/phospho-acceptor domain-containing protein [Pyrinomonadaceae bacterium]|jgi:nitrogen-specific signal transduction histidine kinase|nr:histidine kinase dimerization/phospho-acceptor domain-containing protein [Pyrinomonadaceae bacterium]